MTTVIEASSGTYRSRVDGTIVLSVEIEPRFRAEALALFGMPGTPLALAALKSGQQFKEKPQEAPKHGPICQWLVMRCKEPEFRDWAFVRGATTNLPIGVADWIRDLCGVASRVDIDGNAEAEALFEKHIRKPWLARKA